MITRTLSSLGPTVLAPRMVHDRVIQLHAPPPGSRSLPRRPDGPLYAASRELVEHKRRQLVAVWHEI